MKAQIKYFFLKLTILIAFFVTLSCEPVQKIGGNSTPNPNAPGEIDVTLHLLTYDGPAVRCGGRAVEWTASSTAGSTQTRKSPQSSDNFHLPNCGDVRDVEGVIHRYCTCPRRMIFNSLAPGTWSISARFQSNAIYTSVNCSFEVRPGQASVVDMYEDFRQCKP